MNELMEIIKPKITIYEEDKQVVRLAMHESTILGPLGAVSGGADILAIAGVWGTLFYCMMQNHGLSITKENAQKICKGIAGGVAKYYVGCKTATTLFNLVPAGGTLLAMFSSSVANIIYTYHFARSVTNSCLTDDVYLDNYEKAKEKIVKNFAFKFTSGEAQEICDIYFNSKYGYAGELMTDVKKVGTAVVNGAKEVSSNVRTKALITKIEIEHSPEMQKIKEKTKDIADYIDDKASNLVDGFIETTFDVVDAAFDVATNVSDRIKNGGMGTKYF